MDQRIPSENMLRQWYLCMLDKAKAEGIVLETRTLYDEYFKNNGMDATLGQAVDPTCLPYFEGDYIPGEIENIIKEVKGEEEAKRQERFSEAVGLESYKKTGKKKGTRSNPGELVHLGQDKIMLRLGQAIYNMRENFMVVHLRSRAFAAAVDGGKDVTGWVDVESDENSLTKKRFKISGKAGSSSLFQLPLHQQKDSLENKEESGCTTEDVTDRDASFSETEKGATVAADDTEKSDASAAALATMCSTPPLVEGANLLHPIEAGLSSREADGFKETLHEISATPKLSNGQREPLAQDETVEATQEKADEQQDSTKAEQTAQSKEPASYSKRGFDEIEPTLSRHFASITRNAKPVGSTADEDEPQETEMFESRQQILNYCQTHRFQFDELRRAKHSTMMILFQLHNPSAPMFLQQCGACYRDIIHGTRYHCNDCSNFDLCSDCYEPVTTGLWDKRDSRFTHDKRHTFVAFNMEGPVDTQKSRDERARTIKLHLELLSHAAICSGPPSCSLNNCQRMKKLFEHVESCEVTYEKGCKICSRLLALLTIHARMCTVRGSCPLPFCNRIRERNRRRKQQQQLMDDRRRQAQNELYRGELTT
jgi:TAZ zinc finger/Zinc finger, ZZ type